MVLEENTEMTEEAKQEKINWKIVRTRTCIRAGLIFLGVLGMQVLAALLLGVFASIIAFAQSGDSMEMVSRINSFYNNMGTYTILLSIICAVASGIWCGILYYRSDWRVRPFDYRKAFPLSRVLLIAVTVSGSCVLISILLGMLQQLMPNAFSNYYQVMEAISGGGMLLNIIYVVAIGPVSEELIFRGALFDRFYLAFPFWTANVLQALLFGIYHMNVIQGIYAFLLGMLLGMVRQMTGSIFASIFSHMIFNATSYGLTWLLGAAGKYAGVGLCVLLLFSAVAVFFGGRIIWKNCTKSI